MFTILQGLGAAIVFLVPGLAVLLAIPGRRAGDWPLGLLLPASFCVSVVLVAVLTQASVSLLSASAGGPVAWAFAGLCLAWLAWRGRREPAAAWARVGRWERRGVALLVAVLAIWLALLPLSPYPAQPGEQLGDPPMYLHAAQQLASGAGWSPAYFIADYPGGDAVYVRNHPLPALSTTFLFRLFGANHHSLFVFGMLAAVLLPWLVATQALRDAGGAVEDSPRLLAGVAFAALLPGWFLLFGLGAVAAPTTLGFALLAALATWPGPSCAARRVAIGASLVVMAGSRPEGTMLAVLAAAVWAGWNMATTSRVRPRTRAAAAASGVVVLVVAAPPALSALAAVLPESWSGLSLMHLHYDATREIFAPIHQPWALLNDAFIRVNLEGPDAVAALGNPAVIVEMAEHPLAFGRYLAGLVPDLLDRLAGAMLGESLARVADVPSAAGAVVGFGVPLVALASRRDRRAVATALGFLLVLPLANQGFDDRHVLPVTGVLLTAALGWLLRSWPREPRVRLGGLGVVLAAGLLAHGAATLAMTRLAPANRNYLPVLNAIERLAGPDDLVLCSYPQLVAVVTGRRAVGGSRGVEWAGAYARRFDPDLIALDELVSRRKAWVWIPRPSVDGYRIVEGGPGREYVILRRASAPVP